jgi:hypothetical protein
VDSQVSGVKKQIQRGKMLSFFGFVRFGRFCRIDARAPEIF